MAVPRRPTRPSGFGRTLWRASRRKVALFLVAATATLGATVGSAFGNPALDSDHPTPSIVGDHLR